MFLLFTVEVNHVEREPKFHGYQNECNTKRSRVSCGVSISMFSDQVIWHQVISDTRALGINNTMCDKRSKASPRDTIERVAR